MFVCQRWELKLKIASLFYMNVDCGKRNPNIYETRPDNSLPLASLFELSVRFGGKKYFYPNSKMTPFAAVKCD